MDCFRPATPPAPTYVHVWILQSGTCFRVNFPRSLVQAPAASAVYSQLATSSLCFDRGHHILRLETISALPWTYLLGEPALIGILDEAQRALLAATAAETETVVAENKELRRIIVEKAEMVKHYKHEITAIEGRRAREQRDPILFAFLKWTRAKLRGQNEVLRFRKEASSTDHEVKTDLESLMNFPNQCVRNLRQTGHGSAVFTTDNFVGMNATVRTAQRHSESHLECDIVALVAKILVLEHHAFARVGQTVETFALHVIALVLGSLGFAAVIHEIRDNDGLDYTPVCDEQIARLCAVFQ